MNIPQPPCLSICYATKNRSAFFENSVRSLLEHCSCLPIIDLVVIDSSDDVHSTSNQLFLESIKPLFNRVHYENTIPQGTDSAYHLAIRSSQGSHIWLLSDDDLVCESTDIFIDQIHKLIASSSKTCLLINMSLSSSDLSKVYIKSLVHNSESALINKHPVESIINFSGFLSSHISFVIFRRDLWLDTFEFFPSFPHLTIAGINLYLASVYDYALISPPFLLLRSGCQSWKKESYSIWYHQWPSLLLYLGLTPSSVLLLPSYTILTFMRNLIFYKAINSSIHKHPLLYSGFSLFHKLCFLFVKHLPQVIAYRLSILLSTFSRYPEITLQQLLENY